jgi:hypothetical protein
VPFSKLLFDLAIGGDEHPPGLTSMPEQLSLFEAPA